MDEWILQGSLKFYAFSIAVGYHTSSVSIYNYKVQAL